MGSMRDDKDNNPNITVLGSSDNENIISKAIEYITPFKNFDVDSFYDAYDKWRENHPLKNIKNFYDKEGDRYQFLNNVKTREDLIEQKLTIKKYNQALVNEIKNENGTVKGKITELVNNSEFLNAIPVDGKAQLLYLYGKCADNNEEVTKNLKDIISACEEEYDSEKSEDHGKMLRAAYVAGVNQGLVDESKKIFRRLLWDKNFRKMNSDFHLKYWTENNDAKKQVTTVVYHLSESLKNKPKIKIERPAVAKSFKEEKSAPQEELKISPESRKNVMRWLFKLFTSCTIWQDVWAQYKNVATGDKGVEGLPGNFADLVDEEKETVRFVVSQTVETSVDHVLEKLREFGIDKNTDKDLIEYLVHMKDFCNKRSFEDVGSFFKILSDSYRSFCRVREAKRRNWLIRGVDSSQCESVAEHIYSAWLLASLFLPEKLPEDYKEYCKQDILSMLLIHDLPKSRTGDHSTYHRDLDREKEEYNDKMMQDIAFYATFHVDGADLSEWRLWNQWFDGTTCNAKIAHDINRIQAVFQFLQYRKSGLLKFDENIGFFHWWLCHYDDHYYQSISGIYSMTIERYEAIDGGILAGKSDEIDTNKRIVQSKLQSIKNLKEEIDTIKSVDNKKSGQDTSKDPWLYTALCKELAINVLGNVGNYNAPGAEDDKVFHKMKDLEKHLKDLEEAVEKLKEENEKYEDQQKPPSSKPPKKPKPPKH